MDRKKLFLIVFISQYVVATFIYAGLMLWFIIVAYLNGGNILLRFNTYGEIGIELIVIISFFWIILFGNVLILRRVIKKIGKKEL